MIKRLTSILLVMALCACFMPIVSFAQNYSDALYDYVVSELSKGNYTIDTSKYDLKVEHLQEFYQDFCDNEPQFFFLDSCRYSISYDGKYVYALYFSSSFEGGKSNEKVKFVEDSVKAIIDTVPEGLDDLEKAMYLHDYICLNFEYDLTYSIYDVYNLLKNETGVCQAYTELYDLLLQAVGIESRTASSDSHIWNQVYINGNWYNIDTTWDDPVADRKGSAFHNDCMGTNATFLSTHGDFVYKYDCNDNSFESYSWLESTKPFGFAYGETYMVDGKSIKRINLATDESETVYTVKDTWYVGEGYYTSGFLGMGSYDNKLIFNDTDDIFALDPKTGEVEVLCTPELPANNNLYGCYVSKGNSVVYFYGPSYGQYEFAQFDLQTSDEEEVLGDVNADGIFDIFDYMLVKSICLNITDADETLRKAADVNEDGSVDVFDYMQLKTWYLNQ